MVWSENVVEGLGVVLLDEYANWLSRAPEGSVKGFVRVDDSTDDVALASLRYMRRSTIKLALRMETAGSVG